MMMMMRRTHESRTADVFSLYRIYGQWPTLLHPQGLVRGLRDTLRVRKGFPIER